MGMSPGLSQERRRMRDHREFKDCTSALSLIWKGTVFALFREATGNGKTSGWILCEDPSEACSCRPLGCNIGRASGVLPRLAEWAGLLEKTIGGGWDLGSRIEAVNTRLLLRPPECELYSRKDRFLDNACPYVAA